MGEKGNIRVYQTLDHACGYWPGRSARDLVLDPQDPTLPALYGAALALGFRRSGQHVYRPNCSGCSACTPVRLAVGEFSASRSQRRCMARNADLHVRMKPALRTEETFELYRSYVSSRHPGGGMDDPTPADFDAFLACEWSPTMFMEFREGETLIAVAATDVLDNSLSAVYTYFAADQARRSLGTFAILSQVEHARAHGLDHVYLGFWLQHHPKMDYKRSFRPLEYLSGKQWLRFPQDPGQDSPG